MGLIQYIKVAMLNSLGVLVGIVWVPVDRAVAQSLPLKELDVQFTQTADFWDSEAPLLETVQSLQGQNLPMAFSQAKSLEELYQLRDRLKIELNQASEPPKTADYDKPWKYELQLKQYESLLKNLREVEARIILERKAAENWERGLELAGVAVKKGKNDTPSAQSWAEAEDFWGEAIKNLRQIPPESMLAEQAIEKTIQYQGYLAIATYERLTAVRTVATTPRIKANSFRVAAGRDPGFTIYGDTNRDGATNQEDKAGKTKWSLGEGPLMLFNNDDDDGDRIPDWQDGQVNGTEDEADLAIVNLNIAPEYDGSEIYLTTDSDASARINVFQKTASGWQEIDLSGKVPLEFAENIVLGVEAKQFADRNWTGVVSLKAIAKKDGKEIAFDGMVVGVVPWIVSPNTAPVTEVHVSDRGFDNQEFVAQIQQIVAKTGITAKIIPGGPTWMQDTKEIGYVQFPREGKVENYNVALEANSNNSAQTETSTQSLLNPDFGWFEMGEPRQLEPVNRWSDALGNLAVTPALPGYPMGRVYYGDSGDASFDPEIIDFIKAQKLQGPPVDIDTSWLLTRHVDEIISFIPSQSGKPLMAIVSPEAGIKMLEKLGEMGYGQAAINRGLSTQTTVRAALANKTLIQHNLNLQRNKLNPLLKKLKREFQLTDDQIIIVPTLFGYSGYAWCPNLVNSVVVNGELLVSNPRGPIINGRDYFQEQFRQLMAVSGLNVNFMEDSYYQELRGNTRDATNTTRQGEEKPFWESMPANYR